VIDGAPRRVGPGRLARDSAVIGWIAPAARGCSPPIVTGLRGLAPGSVPETAGAVSPVGSAPQGDHAGDPRSPPARDSAGRPDSGPLGPPYWSLRTAHPVRVPGAVPPAGGRVSLHPMQPEPTPGAGRLIRV